ncbi:hypothetical protein JTB14_033779 [Gonioctena quinquepunctata]|nr:hypothetical protein JTB14_033779 [Gonioctena quinquepunctata]
MYEGVCLNCNGQSCSNSAPFEDEDVTFIGVEAEIGGDSPFEDDPDEEDLDMQRRHPSFSDKGPSTSKKMRT